MPKLTVVHVDPSYYKPGRVEAQNAEQGSEYGKQNGGEDDRLGDAIGALEVRRLAGRRWYDARVVVGSSVVDAGRRHDCGARSIEASG